MKSQMQNQEPHAEHHFADFLESLLIWGSIVWPLKCKLRGFFGYMLFSRAPPPCVVLCQSPKVNFPGPPRVTKLFCIGSPLNRSRSLTYCTLIFALDFTITSTFILAFFFFKVQLYSNIAMGVWIISRAQAAMGYAALLLFCFVLITLTFTSFFIFNLT